jgi:hypothetical protein
MGKPFRQIASYIWCFCTILVIPDALQAAVGYNAVAVSGSVGTQLGYGPALGAGFDFGGLGTPVINNSGQVAFIAGISGPDVSFDNLGVWEYSNGAISLLASKGFNGPGPNVGDGVDFMSFGFVGVVSINISPFPLIDDAGDIAFSATITGSGISPTNNSGIWTNVGGSLAPVARIGPQGPGPNVGSGVYFSEINTPAFSISGKVAFSALLHGVTGARDADGIWTTADGVLAPAARRGTTGPAPGPGIEFVDFETFAPAINSNGKVAGHGDITSDGLRYDVIWTSSKQSVVTVASSGSMGPGPNLEPGITFNGFYPEPTINSLGAVAFRAYVRGNGIDSTNNIGIWTNAGGPLAAVAQIGSDSRGPKLSAGIQFATLGAPLLDSAGDVAFPAAITGPGVTSSNNQGIWTNRGGALTLIARTGSGGPGPNVGTGVNFSSFIAEAQNAQGNIVFSATLTGAGVTSNNDTGLWEWANGKLNEIVREGDLFEVDPRSANADLRTVSSISFMPYGGENGFPAAFNDHGVLAFQLGFTDGSSGVFTAQMRMPGDLNLDGQVTSADLNALLVAMTDLNAYKARYHLSESDLLAIADIDHDYNPLTGAGGVTNADLQALIGLLKQGGAGSAAVPEPAKFILFAVGALAIWWRRN